ncbi:MAG: hypothetical protein ABIT20_11720 [Gemmatimonadaceae bacterium]
MLLPLLLFAQLAAGDSTYSSDALRALVARATVANHAPPPSFLGYRAHVESEMSLLLRDTLGRERAAQLEQLASSVQWQRGGEYEMHVVGYRAQGLGSPISTLSFIRGWTEPSLFGERLRLGALVVGDSVRRDSTRTDTIVVVHPFASDRDRFYRFSGGDTVTVLRSGTRSISVVRIHVTPWLRDSTRLGAFDGEIDLDAERGQIVRMRGRFVVAGPPRKGRRPLMTRMPGLLGVAYGEFVNTEVNGRYWLPAFQRSEFQSTFALMGHTRAVMRILSTFSNYAVEETNGAFTPVADTDRIPHRTTWAPSDSISRFSAWNTQLGDATNGVTANDFDDLAPDAWKSAGAPRLDFVPTNIDNYVRFNRVEGLYTGMEANLHMRSLVPGLSMGAVGGIAWSEKTARGGAHVSLQRNQWTYGLRAERTLPTTNDFIRPFEPQGGGIAALLGSVDDFDYVDRRVALISATRVVGSVESALITAQLGVGDDRTERARLQRGLFGSDDFRPNRGVSEGSYALGIVDVELHPGISGDFVQPGVGATLHLEAGRGGIDWRRVELTLSGRKYYGPISLSAEAQGGAVFSSVIPSQQLFELGGSAGLSGYEYKEFVGDRAALFRSYASYQFPLWRAPIRVKNFFVPGLSPGFAVGLQGGWTGLSSNAGRVAARNLGALPVPVVSDGIRATIGLGATLFNGSVHIGAARPIDQPAPWKLAIGVGPLF